MPKINSTATEIESSIKKTNKITNFIIETGAVEVDDIVWTYKKYSNGLVEMWCTVSAAFATSDILEKQGVYFPFEFTSDAIGFVSINEWSNEGKPKIPRILCKTNRCSIQVHNHLNNFSSNNTANVAVFVIGQLVQ